MTRRLSRWARGQVIVRAGRGGVLWGGSDPRSDRLRGGVVR